MHVSDFCNFFPGKIASMHSNYSMLVSHGIWYFGGIENYNFEMTENPIVQ